jgi:hypothetical protein
MDGLGKIRNRRGFCQSRDPLNQQVSVGEQSDQHAVHELFLPHEHMTDLLDDHSKRLAPTLDFIRKLLNLFARVDLTGHDRFLSDADKIDIRTQIATDMPITIFEIE